MNSSVFEGSLAVAIILNAVLIGVETDLAAMHPEMASHVAIFGLSTAFTVIFLVEWVCNIAANGSAFFKPRQIWNWMDTVIVLASTIELCIVMSAGRAADHQPSKGRGASSQFRMLRILRITRLIKIVRATRLVKFIRALRTLVHQMVITLKSMVWVVVLLVMLIFSFGTLFTQAATSHRNDSEYVSPALMRYWLSLPRSMLTLFMTISGGLDWEACLIALSDVSPLWVGVYLAYVFFAQMAVLNVVTGVFCQGAIDSAAHDHELLTQSVLAERQTYTDTLRGIFRQMEFDENGVTILEFQDCLGDENIQAYLHALGIDTADVWTLFKLLDVDKGNVIDLDEFVSGVLRMKGFAKGFDLAKLGYEQKVLHDELSKFMRRTDQSFVLLKDAGSAQRRMSTASGAGDDGESETN
mmetsp:Transcript_57559/g.187011  ORF Transcript_57559/g.187011 Transcript_57559/m.187011 type:complete len:412 (+) Transcript_57559:459-1694(+)